MLKPKPSNCVAVKTASKEANMHLIKKTDILSKFIEKFFLSLKKPQMDPAIDTITAEMREEVSF